MIGSESDELDMEETQSKWIPLWRQYKEEETRTLVAKTIQIDIETSFQKLV